MTAPEWPHEVLEKVARAICIGDGDDPVWSTQGWMPHARDALDALSSLIGRDALMDLLNGEAPNRWRHKKRGTEYTEIGRGTLQANVGAIEGSRMVAYRAEDGTLWFRLECEFEDGRFEKIAASPYASSKVNP